MNQRNLLIVVGITLISMFGAGGYYFVNQRQIANQKPKAPGDAFEESLKKEGLTREEWERASEEADKITSDFRVKNNINQIQMSLMFFFGKNKTFPKTLDELYPEFIQKEILENNKYLYAYRKDMSFYHLGAKINKPDNLQTTLQSDADINSVSKGYINGFDGADPIYDVISKQ